MIAVVVAKKEAAKGQADFPQPGTENKPQDVVRAMSITPRFADIRAIVESAGPLRRPNRNRPMNSPSLDQELSAWDAASDEVWDSIED
jgi:hypothetical protein